MKSIRPDIPEPLKIPRHSIGTIMLRFAVLLVVAVVVMALAWQR
jgi:hypothetical protein